MFWVHRHMFHYFPNQIRHILDEINNQNVTKKDLKMNSGQLYILQIILRITEIISFNERINGNS